MGKHNKQDKRDPGKYSVFSFLFPSLHIPKSHVKIVFVCLLCFIMALILS